MALLGSRLAHADLVQFATGPGANGHYYEVVPACRGISWDAANVAASLRSFVGVQGHLATSTSDAEDQFLDRLRASVLPSACGHGSQRTQAWIGGYQARQRPGASPGRGWVWVNDEGSIPGVSSVSPYANWAGGEPNDGDGVENNEENHLTLGRFAGVRGWNDEGTAPQLVGGYIVEFDFAGVLSIENCIAAGNCSPLPNQTLGMSNAKFNPGAVLRFEAFEVPDQRFNAATGLCDLNPNAPFAPFEPFGPGALSIPWYLCGSPNWLILKIDATEVQFSSGTVFIENEKVEGNEYECHANPLLNDPLQKRDVVIWQATDPTKMLENGFIRYLLPNPDQLKGAAGEFTSECINPSRGLAREASWYVQGGHVDSRIAYGPVPVGNQIVAYNQLDQHDVFEFFVGVLKYKLLLLQEAIEAARPVLKNGDYTKMKEQIVNAIKLLDHDNYDGALNKVETFLKFHEKAKYGTAFDGFNHQGEHSMRGENIRFWLVDRIIPNEP